MFKNAPCPLADQPFSCSQFHADNSVGIAAAADYTYQWLADLMEDDNDPSRLWGPAGLDKTSAAAAGLEYFLTFKKAYRHAPVSPVLIETLSHSPKTLFYEAFKEGASLADGLSDPVSPTAQNQAFAIHQAMTQLGTAVKAIVTLAGDAHPMHERLAHDQDDMKRQPEVLADFRAEQATGMLIPFVEFARVQGASFSRRPVSRLHPL